MKETKTYRISIFSLLGTWARDLGQLVKLRLSLMVVLTSVIAFFITSASEINWWIAALLATGGFLVAGAANAINQALEKDFDAVMERTKDRPVAAGRMKYSEAVLYGGIMAVLGLLMLGMISPIAALLGALAFISYAFVYTPMKRFSAVAVSIGALPGALPVLIGCVAAQGTITPLAIMLFGIQFLWQFPHFWAIGYLGFEDYKKAGFRLVPENNGTVASDLGRNSIIYTLILIPVSLSAWWIGQYQIWVAILLLMIGLGFVVYAVKFHRNPMRKTALGLMFSSLIYLPLVFSLLLFG